jgi:hypothetical protein
MLVPNMRGSQDLTILVKPVLVLSIAACAIKYIEGRAYPGGSR